MAAVQITITFTGGSQSSVIVPVPAGIDATQQVRNIVHAGGAWYTDANGISNWVPISQITKVTSP